MHRSSESVAALASALAKAQAELVNPEKSLTATIRTGRTGQEKRTFRYAPLSSGLDIVRKALGLHEIATVQTTAIDPGAGIVNLTTMLAHASGEWIASDWPVCAIAETANPQRMGAALTYARRYALFTLVGIAGEDDLDAPDLCDGPPSPSASALDASVRPTRDQLGGTPQTPGNGHAHDSLNRERPPFLDADQSSALREKLLLEIGSISSPDIAAAWAREALAAKNSLTAADAKLVEDGFERRLSELSPSEISSNDRHSEIQVAAAHKGVGAEPTDPGQTTGIDKSALAVAAPRRYRNSEHLRSVAKQSCLICGRRPSDPHHLRYLQPRALGRKASDEFAVPLCRVHHRSVHRAETSERGGRQPVSTQSRSPASCGKRPSSMRGGSIPRARRKPPAQIEVHNPEVTFSSLQRRPDLADMLTQIAACEELFHTATGTAFADLLVEGHRETWPIRSKRFRGWLRRRYYEATGGALTGQAISSELDLLEARAQFDAPERSVDVRLAEDAGRIYLDLADDQWRAVEIGPGGWRVIGCPPVRFRRLAGLLPLPLPQRGGSLEQLACLLNLAGQNDFVLVVSWLLAALRPSGPYPVLAISGEQGSAKTVLSKMLRGLVDPNVAPVRALPRDERELFIAGNNGHVLAFDNISRLRPWLSDALCRLASGGSFAVRQLYTDQDEVLFDAARPVILNGIEEVITRPDLADRSIFLTLPPVVDGRRQPERELWRQFELARPRILGALFDLVVHGLRTLPDIGVDRLPRMADFALWAAACEPALWRPGTFRRVYEANRRVAIECIIDADPVAAYVREIMAERSSWNGTAADLLHAGAERGADEISSDRSGWPQNPRALAGRLRRAQTFLRVLGIDITFSRGGRDGSRIIRMRAHSKIPSAPSVPSALPDPGSEQTPAAMDI